MPSIARPGRTLRVVSVGRWRHIGSHRSSPNSVCARCIYFVGGRRRRRRRIPNALSRLPILFQRRHLIVAPPSGGNIAAHSSMTPTATFTATNTRWRSQQSTRVVGTSRVVSRSVSGDCKLTLPSTMQATRSFAPLGDFDKTIAAVE